MRSFVVVGIFLMVGLAGCGGGESGSGGNLGQVPSSGEPVGAAALKTQVENNCPRSTQSDFCSRAYRAIAQWVAGEITDEEFVNQIVMSRGGETTVVENEEQTEPLDVEEFCTPTLKYDVEEFCTPTLKYDGRRFVEFNYDPAWEDRVNIRQRAVYTGKVQTGSTYYAPGTGHVIEEATENLRIYSYDPNGTSYQNTAEVIEKWACVNTHGRSIAVRDEGRDEPEYEVTLFFRESLVPSLLERYARMTHGQVVEDLVRSQLGTWDFVDSVSGREGQLALCADSDPCLPSRGSREWRAIYGESEASSYCEFDTTGGEEDPSKDEVVLRGDPSASCYGIFGIPLSEWFHDDPFVVHPNEKVWLGFTSDGFEGFGNEAYIGGTLGVSSGSIGLAFFYPFEVGKLVRRDLVEIVKSGERVVPRLITKILQSEYTHIVVRDDRIRDSQAVLDCNRVEPCIPTTGTWRQTYAASASSSRKTTLAVGKEPCRP